MLVHVMHFLCIFTDAASAPLQRTVNVIGQNMQLTRQLDPDFKRHYPLGAQAKAADDASDKKLIDFFSKEENEHLINSKCLLDFATPDSKPCSPLYKALINDKYTLAVWFLDNGWMCEQDATTQKLFFQRAIEHDHKFDNKHIQWLLKHKRDILATNNCIFATIPCCSNQQHSALEYAECLGKRFARKALKDK